MTNRKNRFNLFKNGKFKLKLKNRGEKKKSKDKTNDEKSESSDFLSFDSIIPENSPLKNNSHSSSGFYNDEFSLKEIQGIILMPKMIWMNLMKNTPNTYILQILMV